MEEFFMLVAAAAGATVVFVFGCEYWHSRNTAKVEPEPEPRLIFQPPYCVGNRPIGEMFEIPAYTENDGIDATKIEEARDVLAAYEQMSGSYAVTGQAVSLTRSIMIGRK